MDWTATRMAERPPWDVYLVTRSITDKLWDTMRRLEVLGPLWGFTEFNRFVCPRCLSRRQRSVSLGRKVSQPRSGGGRLPARHCRVGDISNHTASVVRNRRDARALTAPPTTC